MISVSFWYAFLYRVRKLLMRWAAITKIDSVSLLIFYDWFQQSMCPVQFHSLHEAITCIDYNLSCLKLIWPHSCLELGGLEKVQLGFACHKRRCMLLQTFWCARPMLRLDWAITDWDDRMGHFSSDSAITIFEMVFSIEWHLVGVAAVEEMSVGF